MKCKLCEDKLLAFLYGELGEEDAASFKRHLEASESCRDEYDGLVCVLNTVRRVEEEGPPAGVHTRIMGHAEERRRRGRPFWTWVLRPAVTTLVIGVITAGVYFTTLRHRASVYLGEGTDSERLLSEEAVPANLPPASEAQAPPSGKDAVSETLRAKPPGPFNPDRGKTKTPSVVADEGLPGPASPGRQRIPFSREASRDEEQLVASPSMKAEALPPSEERAVAEGLEGEAPPRSGVRSLPSALGAAQGQDLPSLAHRAPETIARALELASKKHCKEAEGNVQAFSTEHPGEESCGTAWLATARCFLEEGDLEAARETAEKALRFPAYADEAQAFLESLPPSGE